MAKLKTARVRRSKGTAVHRVLTSRGSVTLPDPARVSIEEDGGSYFLLREDRQGTCVADTWHESLEEAIRQADLEYELDAWDPV